MLKWPKVLLIVLCAIGFGFWFFRSAPSYDRARVDSRLLALRTPYAVVACSYYMDGGSIGMRMVDRDGIEARFAIPAHLGESDRYRRVFMGALYDAKPGAMEIVNPEDTRRMLVRILQDFPRRDPWDDFCLMQLRGSPVDYARWFTHRALGHYRR